MHAIVMVHKMQSMTLSNHQLLPNKNSETSSEESGAVPTVCLPVHYKAREIIFIPSQILQTTVIYLGMTIAD